MSFSQCSLPLSDLQAYGENLDLWSVPFDINYAEHMAFPKILQGTVLWVSFIISCHNDISLQRKAKLLLWDGELMENRKKVNTVANKGHLKILLQWYWCISLTMHHTLHELELCEHKQGGTYASFLGTLFIYVRDNASAYRGSLIKHIYEN